MTTSKSVLLRSLDCFFLKLIEPLSAAINWHSSETELGRGHPCRTQVEGRELDLCELALVLRFADTVYFSGKGGSPSTTFSLKR